MRRAFTAIEPVSHFLRSWCQCSKINPRRLLLPGITLATIDNYGNSMNLLCSNPAYSASVLGPEVWYPRTEGDLSLVRLPQVLSDAYLDSGISDMLARPMHTILYNDPAPTLSVGRVSSSLSIHRHCRPISLEC